MKKWVQKLLWVGLFSFVGISASFGQGVNWGATPLVVGQNNVNHYGSFTLNLTTGNGNGNAIAGGTTELDIEFGAGFVLSDPNPDFSILSMSNGNTTSSVFVGSINGNVITITASVSVAFNGAAFSINIPSNFLIVNPVATGSAQTVRVKRTDNATFSAWQNATFQASNTQTTPASITPNASVQNRTSEYTIQFSTGAGGFLRVNSTITTVFPSGFLPIGNLPGVSINGSPAFASVINATTAVFEVPVNIGNESLVSIIVPRSAGINNPALPGNYTIDVFTSIETTPVTSNTFNIATNEVLSFSAIQLSDNTANANSSYTIEFVVSSSGALSRALNDRIRFTLPSETFVPGSIPNTAIDVTNQTTGFSGNPTSITVDNNTISFPTPIDINNSNDVKVFVKTTAGLLNPFNAGTYSVTGVTTESNANQEIDAPANSNPYSIGAPSTTVSQASVSLSSAAPSATNVTYTFVLTLGNNGRLVQNTSTVTLEFPAAYNSANLTNNVNFTINGNAASKSVNGTIVTLTTPINLSNNQEFTIVATNVTNPVAQTYTVGFRTSSEPNVNQSESFTVSNVTMGVSTITLSENRVNRASQFTVGYTNAGTIDGTGGNTPAGWIEVRFPEGTVIPSSIANANVTVAENNTNWAVTTNPTGRIVRATRTANNSITLNAANTVVIAAAAGVTNASIPKSGMTVEMRSSANPSWITSTGNYSIISNDVAVTNVQVQATPQVATGDTVAYQITFNSGAFGRLVGGAANGSNNIIVTFPATIQVPNTIAPTNVRIQGISLNSASVVGQTFTLPIPNGQNIAASSEITVQFDRQAGIRAPVLAQADIPQIITVSTTAESNNANGSVTFTDFSELVVNSVNLSPTTINAPASYTISFTLGTGNNLNVGDKIRIVFPNNTRVPNPFSRTHVLIDNTQPTSNPVITGNTMTLVTPVALNADQIYTIQISSSGQVLNPTTVGSSYFLTFQTLRANDAVVEGPVNSPLYSTTATVSTVSTPSVNLSNFNPSVNSNYTITFNTGNFGRMISGTSTFTVTFPTGTDASAATVTVNGADATVTGTNTTRTVTLPNSVTINNNSAVTLVFTGVTNPTANIYTLAVRTSVETTNVNSTSYNINANGPVTIAAPTNAIGQDTVNAPTNIQLNFTPTVTIPNGGTISIRFPTGNILPPTIGNGTITLSTAAVSSISVNLSQRLVTLTLGAQITNGQATVITFLPTSGILNPSEPGDYFYEIFTSVQPTPNTTESINAPLSFRASTNTSVSNLVVVVNPQVSNQPVNWTWTFTTGARGALVGGVGTILMGFDQSVFTQGGNFPISAVKINNATPQSFVYDPVENTLRLTVPTAVNIGNSSNVEITISTAAGIEVDPNLAPGQLSKAKGPSNPSVSSSNEFFVATSSETSEFSAQFNPLPVELINFEVVMRPQNLVPVLVWSTATERENYGFYIERQFLHGLQASGGQPRTEPNPDYWVEAGFVPGNGFSTNTIEYEFKDNGVEEAGVYLYRMRQVDFDGTETIYGPIELTFQGPTEFRLFDNYPNPFNPSTNIQYTVPRTAEVRIYIYDVLGRLVMKLVDEEKAPGRYVAVFDGKHLSSGMYLINMRADGNVFTKKMMLIK